MLLVDKYRPTSLDKMDIHKELSQRLKRIVQPIAASSSSSASASSSSEMTTDNADASREETNGSDLPHLLFYGPSGAGKKTRIVALLRQVFGARVEKLKLEHREMKVGASGSRSITVTSISSPFHIELNPSEAGYSDRYVISQMFKEIAATAPLDSSGDKWFKVVVLNEVDELTREAQQALRRTMEKYMRTCRVIMCATSTSKVIAPVKSRCLCIRVPAPTEQEIVTVMEKVAKSENIQLPKPFAQKIAGSCDRNLRRALLMLEAAKVQQYPFRPNDPIRLADWERFIHEIGNDMIKEQTPKKILEIRDKLYTLITSCVPPDLILRKLTDYLLHRVLNEDMQHQVIHWSAHYEHRLKMGTKAIFHLEAFVAKFMSLHQLALMDMM